MAAFFVFALPAFAAEEGLKLPKESQKQVDEIVAMTETVKKLAASNKLADQNKEWSHYPDVLEDKDIYLDEKKRVREYTINFSFGETNVVVEYFYDESERLCRVTADSSEVDFDQDDDPVTTKHEDLFISPTGTILTMKLVRVLENKKTGVHKREDIALKEPDPLGRWRDFKFIWNIQNPKDDFQKHPVTDKKISRPKYDF